MAPAAAEDLSPRAAAAADAAAAEGARRRCRLTHSRRGSTRSTSSPPPTSRSASRRRRWRRARRSSGSVASSSDRDYGGLSLKHIQESNQQAVAQLNHQVDFLNAQCAELQAEVEATRGSYACWSVGRERGAVGCRRPQQREGGVRSNSRPSRSRSRSSNRNSRQRAALGIERRWRGVRRRRAVRPQDVDHRVRDPEESRETRACAERFLASENRTARPPTTARRLASASTERILESSRPASAVSTRAGMRAACARGPRPMWSSAKGSPYTRTARLREV